MAVRIGRQVRRRWKLLLPALLVSLALAEYWLYPLVVSPAWPVRDQGRNGLWVRYKWYFGENTDYKGLADKLNNGRFRYAFFHVRFIDRDGSLHFRYPEKAQRLNREVRRLAPETLRIAWIFAGNEAIDGNVDLGNPSVRQKMVAEAKWLVEKCGFDGVQWDYEICPDGDQGFLRLLEETRKSLPEEAFLSAAVPSAYSWPFRGLAWSGSYFREVAMRTDQMAVMGYDTGAYFARWYVRHLQGSMRIIDEAVRQTKCRVLIGLATYEDGPPSHNPRSENLRMGLAAVKGVEWPESFEGIALFADYTTDAAEWEMYRRDWLGL